MVNCFNRNKGIAIGYPFVSGGEAEIRRWARKHAKIAFLRTFKTVFTRFSRIFTLKNHKKRILVPKLYLTIFQ